MIKIIGLVLTFGMLIWNEYFSAKAKKEKANEKYILNQKEQGRLLEIALQKMRENLMADSQAAGSVDDQMDSDRNINQGG